MNGLQWTTTNFNPLSTEFRKRQDFSSLSFCPTQGIEGSWEREQASFRWLARLNNARGRETNSLKRLFASSQTVKQAGYESGKFSLVTMNTTAHNVTPGEPRDDATAAPRLSSLLSLVMFAVSIILCLWDMSPHRRAISTMGTLIDWLGSPQTALTKALWRSPHCPGVFNSEDLDWWAVCQHQRNRLPQRVKVSGLTIPLNWTSSHLSQLHIFTRR
ncbi:hypothetical protein QBC43DRAFT_338178 [Cladorrhinum sp. PSN259]|nr:hypothetical protein QBC43DRAFT_338178 [Cladorrhinum sp. PSN259]